jgi:hypothetical protein
MKHIFGRKCSSAARANRNFVLEEAIMSRLPYSRSLLAPVFAALVIGPAVTPGSADEPEGVASVRVEVPPLSDCGPDPQALSEFFIRRALAEPTQLEFIETPLQDVVDFLRDCHRIEIQLDWTTLYDMGLASDQPVSKNLKGISLGAAISLLVEDLGLTYVIDNDVLLITSPEAAARRMVTRTYAVADLLGDDGSAESLAKLVESAAFPPVAGEADPAVSPRATVFRSVLVVRASQPVQWRVERLLANVRTALGLAHSTVLHPLAGGEAWQSVHLSYRPVTDEDVAHLRAATGLRRLDLDRTCISEKGLGLLTGLAELRHLDLSHNRLGDEIGPCLQSFTKLEHLNLAHTQVGDEAIRQLTACTGLEHLDLSETKITDEGLGALAELKSLETLNLDETAVRDVSPVAQLTNLRSLHLGGTDLDDDAMRHVAGLQNLRELDVKETLITEAAVEHLAKLKRLRILRLAGSNPYVSGFATIRDRQRRLTLGQEAAKRLRDALPHCQIIGLPVLQRSFERPPVTVDPFE